MLGDPLTPLEERIVRDLVEELEELGLAPAWVRQRVFSLFDDRPGRCLDVAHHFGWPVVEVVTFGEAMRRAFAV